jgi:hypothetical protein
MEETQRTAFAMSVQTSIVIGAIIIGSAIVAARIIAPYQVTSGTAIAWRLNTVTGEVKLCNVEIVVGNEEGENRCK